MDVCLQFEDTEVKFTRPHGIHRNNFISRHPKESEGMMRDRQADRQSHGLTGRQAATRRNCHFVAPFLSERAWKQHAQLKFVVWLSANSFTMQVFRVQNTRTHAHRTVGYNCGILAPAIHLWLRGSAVCVTFPMLRWWTIPLLWDQWALQRRNFSENRNCCKLMCDTSVSPVWNTAAAPLFRQASEPAHMYKWTYKKYTANCFKPVPASSCQIYFPCLVSERCCYLTDLNVYFCRRCCRRKQSRNRPPLPLCLSFLPLFLSSPAEGAVVLLISPSLHLSNA